jgi:hypothetical protein
LKKAILLFSAILLAGELLTWCLFYWSPANLPEHIFGPINTAGLFLILLIIIITNVFQQRAIKLGARVGFIKLVLSSVLVILLAEIGFHIFRLAILPDYTFEQMIYYASRGVIGMTVIGLVISAIVALLIRKKDKVAK